MTPFNQMYENLLHSLSERCLVEDISRSFKMCLTDAERVKEVNDLLIDEDVFPLNIQLQGKCLDRSVSFRNAGNIAFKEKKLTSALQQYTRSIAHAPCESIELALAYANRSAVLFTYKQYHLCIADINRSVCGKYPDNLKYKLYERKAKCFFQIGDYAGAGNLYKQANEYLLCASLSEEMKKVSKKNFQAELQMCQERLVEKVNDLSLEKDQTFGLQIDNGSSPACIEKTNDLPPVKAAANTVVPAASSTIELVYDEELGRCLRVTEDIYPGDILVVEMPYASVLLPKFYHSHCYQCLVRCQALIPCQHCSLVMYCSHKCQMKNWEKCHMIECKILPTLLSLKFGNIELLALRILLIATNQGKKINSLYEFVNFSSQGNGAKIKGLNSDGQYLSSDYCTMHNLETNRSLRNNADIFRRCTTATFLVHLLQQTSFFQICSEKKSTSDQEKDKRTVKVVDYSEIPSQLDCDELTQIESFCGALLLRYLQSLPCNAHEVSEMMFTASLENQSYDSLEIGAVAYPVLSLINHSCDPNVIRHSYNGDTVVLRAIQVIKAGEQLFDNYGYHHATHSYKERQACLQEQYYFQCRCVACEEDWPRYRDINSTSPFYLTSDPQIILKVAVSSKVFQNVFEQVLKQRSKKHLDFLYEHLTLLQQSIKRPWKEFSECQETIKQCLCMEANHFICPPS